MQTLQPPPVTCLGRCLAPQVQQRVGTTKGIVKQNQETNSTAEWGDRLKKSPPTEVGRMTQEGSWPPRRARGACDWHAAGPQPTRKFNYRIYLLEAKLPLQFKLLYPEFHINPGP